MGGIHLSLFHRLRGLAWLGVVAEQFWMNKDGSRREAVARSVGAVSLPRKSRADVAEEALRKLIVDGRFPDVLPGVRFLAEALGVGVPTVSEALQRLRADGWIESRGQRTRFVVRGRWLRVGWRRRLLGMRGRGIWWFSRRGIWRRRRMNPSGNW